MADRYLELLTEFKPRPIHSEKALARACRLIERLMRKDTLSADEADMLEMLSVLFCSYGTRRQIDFIARTVAHHLLAILGHRVVQEIES